MTVKQWLIWLSAQDPEAVVQLNGDNLPFDEDDDWGDGRMDLEPMHLSLWSPS